MARVPYLNREDLAPEDQKFWDQLAGSRGNVIGLFRAMMASPDLTVRISSVGGCIRAMKDGMKEYDVATFEVVAMAVAREASCQMEWTSHENAARAAGISDATIDALRRRSTDGLSPRDKAIVDYTWAFMRHQVTDDVFRALVKVLGQRQAVALSLHAGYATMMNMIVNAFQIELAPGVKPLLPVATTR